MVLEKLSESLKNTLQKIAKSMFVDEKLINELIKDIQRALLQADVNVKLVFDLTKKIKDRAKEEAPKGLTKKEQLINIVYEELVKFLGENKTEININKKPTKIMLIGLLGNGKSSTAGKLAKYFKKRGLFLHIVSGWRHPELQKIIKEDYAKKFGCEKADRVFASTDRKVPATHSTGGSFDIELRDLTRKEKIGMDVYYKNEKIPSLYWAEELFNEDKLDSINKEIVKRRRILYHGLCTEKVIFEKNEDTFTAHPGEYWHYGDGDTLSAYLKKESFIRYGIIYP